MSAIKTAPAPSLADDLHQAAALLAPLCGKPGRAIPLVLRLLGAIWLAVERLRKTVQASAPGDDWRGCEASVIARARALRLPAPEGRLGESLDALTARVEAAEKGGG